MRDLIDFHSHILPGIDDGSDSVATSVKLLELSAAQGVTHMAATPHFYAHRDSLEDFLARRRQAAEQLREAVGDRRDLPDFALGAEVYFFRGMSGSEGLRDLALENTDCILVEMPFEPWTEGMYRELELIRGRQGLTPVIAHVERYFGTFSTRGIPERLGQLPVLVQANASFFLDRRTRGRALDLLKKGMIHLLGSDCHNLRSRPPELGDAARLIARHLGEPALEDLMSRSAEIFQSE